MTCLTYRFLAQDDSTVLMLACASGLRRIVEILLNKGALPDFKDKVQRKGESFQSLGGTIIQLKA